MILPGKKPYSTVTGSLNLSYELILQKKRWVFKGEIKKVFSFSDYLDDWGSGQWYGGDYDKWKASLPVGNIDPFLSQRIMQTGLAAAGRYLTVRIRIKDKPGSLAKLLSEIGAAGANIMDVFHLRTDPMLALDEVAVNLTMETRGQEHEKDVLACIKALGHDAQVQ